MIENRVSQFLPITAAPTPASAFIACPVNLLQGWASDIYRIALERALADAQPSPWMRRVMTACVN